MHEIIIGDCLEVMKTFPDDHFTGIVTDPPYGLSFMGKGWDHKVPKKLYWEEALRISKPGAFMIAMGGTRTFHHLTCAIEDAGWEIRDCISYLYGSGFPKSHDISKALDKWNNTYVPGELSSNSRKSGASPSGCYGEGVQTKRLSNPQSEKANLFYGFGTALKPAWEPCIVAMKSLNGTFAQNAEKWGVAGLNIDGCRIPTEDNKDRIGGGTKGDGGCYGSSSAYDSLSNPKGRWPANLILDEEAGRMLDEQSNVLKSGGRDKGNKTQDGGYGKGYGYVEQICQPSSGGASRFFYCAKASSRERNEGLEGLPERSIRPGSRNAQSHDIFNTEGCGRNVDNKPVKNHHPTVKPLSLMEYLIKLISPPQNALILDPFAGSGTTVLAAKRLGISAIGIEKELEYAEIARQRVNSYASKQSDPDLFDDLLQNIPLNG